MSPKNPVSIIASTKAFGKAFETVILGKVLAFAGDRAVSQKEYPLGKYVHKDKSKKSWVKVSKLGTSELISKWREKFF